MTWTAPVDDGGSAITGYRLTSNPASLNSPLDVGNVLMATMTGLTNGTMYTFTVQAINAVGAGTSSAASNPVTPSLPPTPTATPVPPTPMATSPPPAIPGLSWPGLVIMAGLFLAASLWMVIRRRKRISW